MFWTYPTKKDEVINFAKLLDCDYIESVDVIPKNGYLQNDCHNNVSRYVSENPGAIQIYGYYIVESKSFLQAIYHSVVERIDTKLIDVTPYSDGRKKILFARTKIQIPNYDIGNVYYKVNSDFVYGEEEQKIVCTL